MGVMESNVCVMESVAKTAPICRPNWTSFSKQQIRVEGVDCILKSGVKRGDSQGLAGGRSTNLLSSTIGNKEGLLKKLGLVKNH